MKYLVMETHPAYAVVLDEQGRYFKAANLRYEVGDTVGEIVELCPPTAKFMQLYKPLSGLIAAAACFCLVFFGYYTPNYTAYGTLRIQINPDVQLTISQTERVLELDGLNADGMDLIKGYSFAGKSRETATGELMDRAIEMGYLSGGDTVSITVNSKDAQWQHQEETQVQQMLEDRYGERVVIRLAPLESENISSAPMPSLEDDVQVIVPVVPPSNETPPVETPPASSTPTPPRTPPQVSPPPQTVPPSSNIADYDDTDYGPNNDGVTDYDDTDYGPYNDGITDYDNKNSKDDDDDDSNSKDDDDDDSNSKDDDDDDSNGNDDDDDDDDNSSDDDDD